MKAREYMQVNVEDLLHRRLAAFLVEAVVMCLVGGLLGGLMAFLLPAPLNVLLGVMGAVSTCIALELWSGKMG